LFGLFLSCRLNALAPSTNSDFSNRKFEQKICTNKNHTLLILRFRSAMLAFFLSFWFHAKAMVNINEVTFKACFNIMMNTRFLVNLGGKDMDHVVVSSSIGTMLD